MSGGVDSSVAAWLLKEQGYDVIGVTMQIWQDETNVEQEEHGGCCGLSAVDDARRVAERLEIPYYVMNFKKSSKKMSWITLYRNIWTDTHPNPCIACNRYVKWGVLLREVWKLGLIILQQDIMRARKLPNGRYASCKSATAAKDQTYALYNLTQHQLAHTLMPVGEYTERQDSRDGGGDWTSGGTQARTVRRSVSCRTTIMQNLSRKIVIAGLTKAIL